MTPELRAAIDALLNEFHIGDYVYDVRERAAGDSTHMGNTWEHPKVKQFNACIEVLRRSL
jgi:hypothetical protein